MIDECQVARWEDGTPAIVGARSPELADAIRDMSKTHQPTGEGLGMGFRAFSMMDLEFILDQVRKRVVEQAEPK